MMRKRTERNGTKGEGEEEKTKLFPNGKEQSELSDGNMCIVRLLPIRNVLGLRLEYGTHRGG